MSLTQTRMTLVICTHNRSQLLCRCLKSIARQNNLSELDVVVVDNASTDDTKTVCEEIYATNPFFRYVYEPTPGIAYARNRGIKECTSEFIGYLDDDVIPCDNWAETIIETFDTYDADTISGRITLYWEQLKPWWMSQLIYPALGELDSGDDTIIGPGLYPNGANMAFRSSTLIELGGFDNRFGVCSLENQEVARYLGEETDVGCRMEKNGYKLAYCGKASVKHLASAHRFSFQGIVLRAKQMGFTRAVLFPKTDLYAYEETYVWALFCSVSNILRLHVKDAIVFYLQAVVNYAAMQELAKIKGKHIHTTLHFIKTIIKLRRGLLGLIKRMLFARPIAPTSF